MAINNPAGNYTNFIINDLGTYPAQYDPNSNLQFNYFSELTGVLSTGSSILNSRDGRIYDSGGPSNFYANNELGYCIIAPDFSTTFSPLMILTVNSFSTNDGMDFLRIYKGAIGTEDYINGKLPLPINSTGSIDNNPNFALTASYNITLTASTSVSSSGNLILTWYSNASTQGAGFDISWTSNGTAITASKPITYLSKLADGPLSLKRTGVPYTLTVSKTKEG